MHTLKELNLSDLRTPEFQQKIEMIREIREDAQRDFNIKPDIQIDNKIFTYFFKHGNFKYVHKNSLKKIYNNDCVRFFDFLRSGSLFLPELYEETTSFFVFICPTGIKGTGI